MFAAYVVAVSAMLFSALSALTLFRTVEHFDPPEASSSPTTSGSPQPPAPGPGTPTSRPVQGA